MSTNLLAWALRVPEGEALDESPVRVKRDVVRGVGLWAIDVAREVASGIDEPARTGLYVGMGGLRPGWDELMPRLATQDGSAPWDAGLRKFHPFWMLRNLSNSVGALLAAELGTTADGATYGGEDAGGVALHAALEALELGLVKQALVVAYDSLLQPEIRVERAGPLSEAAAAVLLGPGAGPVVSASHAATPHGSVSEYGPARLLVELIESANKKVSKVIFSIGPPGLRTGVELRCSGPQELLTPDV